MDIPIHIQDGDSTLVRFEGCGFDSPTPGSSNPFNCSDSILSVPCNQRVFFPGQVNAAAPELDKAKHTFLTDHSNQV